MHRGIPGYSTYRSSFKDEGPPSQIVRPRERSWRDEDGGWLFSRRDGETKRALRVLEIPQDSSATRSLFFRPLGGGTGETRGGYRRSFSARVSRNGTQPPNFCATVKVKRICDICARVTLRTLVRDVPAGERRGTAMQFRWSIWSTFLSLVPLSFPFREEIRRRSYNIRIFIKQLSNRCSKNSGQVEVVFVFTYSVQFVRNFRFILCNSRFELVIR